MAEQEMVGTRVQMPAWTDEWMRGDRYGEVTEHNTTMDRLTIRLDKSQRLVVVSAEDVTVE